MPNEIENSEPSPDDVLAAIQSFNDPSIITNIFRDLGWSYSLEIKETLTMAKQNANLSIKFKAIKHLRELLREAAETAGYTAKVSQTFPNAQGGQTTFSAKRISGILNPVKKIESNEIKETQNDKEETRTEPNRGSDREQSEAEREHPTETERDTRRAFPPGDADVGGTEPSDGGETAGRAGAGNGESPSSESPDNPCVKTRPPSAGSRELFPGVSSAGND